MRRLHGMRIESGERVFCWRALLPNTSPAVAANRLHQPEQPPDDRSAQWGGRAAVFATCGAATAPRRFVPIATGSRLAKLRDFHLHIDLPSAFQLREMHWRDEATKFCRVRL
jgi:hypothetical protein